MSVWELLQDKRAAKTLSSRGDISGCTELLNEKNQRGPVPVKELLMFCILNGTFANIKRGTLNTDNEELWNACVLFETLLTYNKESIDLDNEGVTAMINSMYKHGVFNESQKEELMALANNRVSLAFKNYGKDFTVDEVTDAIKRGY